MDKILHHIHDVITDTNFGHDRFRSFSVARNQILGFSIDFHRPTVWLCDYTYCQ